MPKKLSTLCLHMLLNTCKSICLLHMPVQVCTYKVRGYVYSRLYSINYKHNNISVNKIN